MILLLSGLSLVVVVVVVAVVVVVVVLVVVVVVFVVVVVVVVLAVVADRLPTANHKPANCGCRHTYLQPATCNLLVGRRMVVLAEVIMYESSNEVRVH